MDTGPLDQLIADAHRREWAFVLAATVRVTRDLDLAEECVQDAYAKALTAWAQRGVPDNVGAWLTMVARNRALDLLRRHSLERRVLPLLIEPSEPAGDDPATDASDFPDDRLRLICTCCHPSLSTEAQVALTLRLLCGLSTAEVARAFLVSEPTMAARLTRAKKKISAARIPYREPDIAELPARIDAVLEVLHLVFTTGHAAPAGRELLRGDLITRAIDLARMLHQLQPNQPEVTGLLALFLLTDARRETRLDTSGALTLLADQDRSRWDRAAIDEGSALVRDALTSRQRRSPGQPLVLPGRFALQAAIAAVHAQAPTAAETNWAEIIGLYNLLLRRWSSPVVALNRAAAIGLGFGPAEGLAALEHLSDEPKLAAYPYFSATRADFLRQLGRDEEARLAYDEAILLTENEVERAFLGRRRAELG